MSSKRDIFYSVGFTFVTIVFTVVICLMTVYYIIGTDIPIQTLIQHILFSSRNDFLCNNLYAAPYVCCIGICVNQWFTIFLPLLSSMPFLIQFAGEFNGFYRMKLSRMSFDKYWNNVFLKVGFSGAGSVIIGYSIFSLVIYGFFPKLSEYGNLEFKAFNTFLNNTFHTQSEFIYWVNRAIVIFAFIFLISVFCLLLFLIFMNRYKAIGFPMIAFYLFDQISTELFRSNGYNGKYYIISPKNILFYTEFTFESWGLNYFWYLIFVIIAVVVIYMIGKKICRGRVTN